MKKVLFLSLIITLLTTNFAYGRLIHIKHGILLNTETGLIWSKLGYYDIYTIKEALSYIKIMNQYATDILKPRYVLKWRLPSKKELLTLADYILLINKEEIKNIWINDTNKDGNYMSILISKLEYPNPEYIDYISTFLCYFGCFPDYLLPDPPLRAEIWMIADKTLIWQPIQGMKQIIKLFEFFGNLF